MLTLGDVLLKTFPRLFEIELGDNEENEYISEFESVNEY